MPDTIASPGIYCLARDIDTKLAAGQAAIVIDADDVVLDLQGHALNNSTAAGVGIGASGRRNVTVRNGTLRGFHAGIAFTDATTLPPQRHVIEGMLLARNFQFGLVIQGNGSTIRDNRVQAIGTATSGQAMGMYVIGPGMRVIDNEITDIATDMLPAGIFLSGADDAAVAGNRIARVSAKISGLGGYGIHVGGSKNVTIKDNVIADTRQGVYFANSTGRYMNNTMRGVATPYTGGTPARNTDR